MKNTMLCLVTLLLLTSFSVFSASINAISLGTYSYTQKGEELIDGQEASITWNIEVKNNHDAFVVISSWHAPFTCDGSYTISNEKEYVALSWSRENNANIECDMAPPQIFLKKSSSGEVLIRSELFPWGE